ncbi:monosaccharide ABC transporter membrane protein (CUT2 family) [Labedella gwakjiensis]|uniref:Autoinducer 2 import system permease protein LsrD n=1 Tax=Labedella gwakjiensis TaxID=390269 RepID=A0A2P8GWM8_9MICO|nr:ABC transporter permease [Labedella gwakjiensis]PSL38364.1 monosaccharide ABC transporter membrane protein (CUT2 family) [Labedella gwakjiensis]RUQ87105.1 ABC transporter permease [Labedella gwakjiensis]
MTSTTVRASEPRITPAKALAFLRDYAVLILLVALLIVLAIASPSFFTFANIINIINQNTPLALIAVAGTFVIISGSFDLSTAAIYAVGSVAAAWVAVESGNVVLGLLAPPVIGLALGVFNGLAVTVLRVHSFLATLASSLIFKAIAVLITGGSLIQVALPGFSELGRGRVGGVFYTVLILIVFVALMWFLLKGTVFGRHVFAVGGNPDAAQLSGVRVDRTRVMVFALSGLAAGMAAAIGVSRIASGQPQAGAGLEFDAIAAIILGGTSIYGGVGAVWRSVAGVFLIALIGNGFDILGFNPQIKDLVTGAIILAAVGLAAAGVKRR